MAKKKEKETLLVAVDFTLFSEEALIFAGKLANKLQAQILVLHVIHSERIPTILAFSTTTRTPISFLAITCKAW